jgi:cytochrome P450
MMAMIYDMSCVSQAMAKELANGTHGVGAFDVMQVMKKITMDVIGLSAFGHRFNCVGQSEVGDVAKAFEFLLDDMTRRQFVSPLSPTSFFYSLPTELNRQHALAKKMVRDTLQDIIRGRKESVTRGEEQHEDLLKYILAARAGGTHTLLLFQVTTMLVG